MNRSTPGSGRDESAAATFRDGDRDPSWPEGCYWSEAEGRPVFHLPEGESIFWRRSASKGTRSRLLDLFCGAGGASMGYHRDGFDVVGVDIAWQPRYPFRFEQMDAIRCLEVLLSGGGRYQDGKLLRLNDFHAVHASPPCQAYTRAGALRTVKLSHPDLIEPTRELLEQTGLPWVIENVPGAPLIDPVQLCGTFWKLGGLDWDLQRHRLFEANFELRGVPCIHQHPAISVVGHGATKATRERLGRNPVITEKRAAMGIDWMNRDELSEAIPPIYTEYVGRQLLAHIGASRDSEEGLRPAEPDAHVAAEPCESIKGVRGASFELSSVERFRLRDHLATKKEGR